MRVGCRQRGSSATDIELEATVSSIAEDENEKSSFRPRLMHDPPAAVFDPAIHDLEAVADEVMRGAGGQRGRLKRVFERAEFELQIPLPRRETVEAFRGPFERLPAYEGDVGVTSRLRLEDLPVGTDAVSLWASIHHEPDDSGVAVDIESHLRSADDRPEIERRLDQLVAHLKA
jgi:hypothetical protein